MTLMRKKETNGEMDFSNVEFVKNGDCNWTENQWEEKEKEKEKKRQMPFPRGTVTLCCKRGGATLRAVT